MNNNEKAVGKVLHETEKRIFQFIPIWKWKKWPETQIFEQEKAIMLQHIEKMIQDRKEYSISIDSKDLLGRLLAAKDPNSGTNIPDSQLRDELITFLIAGHGTIFRPHSSCYFFFSISQKQQQR